MRTLSIITLRTIYLQNGLGLVFSSTEKIRSVALVSKLLNLLQNLFIELLLDLASNSLIITLISTVFFKCFIFLFATSSLFYLL